MATATRVDLTNGEQVQGTLPVGNGGTGATTLAGAGLELSINKNAANGYCGLNSSGYVAPGQLGSGSASSSTFLRGDNSWQVPPAPSTWNVTVSGASSLTLAPGAQAYVYTGSSNTTWTLPAVSGNTGVYFHLENRGTGSITVKPAGSDYLWFLSALTSFTIAAGGSLIVVNDGTYWNTLSTDLANNSVGILGTANGGTGNTSGLAATATALATARTVQTNLASTASASFNGTANITPGVTGTLPVANGGTGQTSLSALPLADPTITGYTETVYNGGTVTTGYTVNLANGTMHRIILTNGDTCAITMPTAFAGMSFMLAVNQPSTTGSGALSWSGVQWPGGTAPVMTTGANKVDQYAFFCFDGSTIRGVATQNYPT